MKENFAHTQVYKEQLYKLAYNVWTMWDYEALGLFREIDEDLFFRVGENPVGFLNKIAEEDLNKILSDKHFLARLEAIFNRYTEYEKKSNYFSKQMADRLVAYFSMEYGLHGSIPVYSGGLGILSGDHLKGASDLGIPIIGVGLFYRYGYFNQRINEGGMQEEFYEENKIGDLPIREVIDRENKPLRIEVNILGNSIQVQVLEANIGKVKLILLNTNISENPVEYRKITDYLYVADRDKRIQQEIVLGFGGYRALKAMGIKPTTYHLNEGHSAFIIIELLREYIKDSGCTFEEAVELVRKSTVFTTHTPVEAGNENFPTEMIEKYLKKDIENLGISFEDFVKLGTNREKEPFWLPALAIRFSCKVNGVSKLHAEVSREMWANLFPNRDVDEVPIQGITNGVHYSWLSSEFYELFVRYLGPEFILKLDAENLSHIFDIPDREIWKAHRMAKERLLRFLERKLKQRLESDILTVGYARRFATYKRATLLLEDKERLKRILCDNTRPIRIIFAGKAHPADQEGKEMIRTILQYAREHNLRDKVFFIENYDIAMARYLVQGVDVWLNNPLKPMEASGTSGMKAGINGVLNLSVPDGWWPECYNGKNGWAITAGEGVTNLQERNRAEAGQIYDLLEGAITVLYYTRNKEGLPVEWVSMMKESIYSVYKNFNIGRMLKDYVEKIYTP